MSWTDPSVLPTQIIDMMLLVVDVTKGIQPQTAECIVIGETTVATGDLVVALNKTGGIRRCLLLLLLLLLSCK